MRQQAEQKIAAAEAKAAQADNQVRNDNAKVGVLHVFVGDQSVLLSYYAWTRTISILLLVSACFMPCMVHTVNWSFKNIDKPDCH